MFFEGSEKKVEIILPSHYKLMEYPLSFWEKLIKKSKAKILNHFSNDQAQAFLLSESSLFVWNNRVTLITCGQTTLKDATLFLLKKFKDTQALFFQRKNELFPMNQRTNFEHDVQQLRKKIKGTAYRFGPLDTHHSFLFHLDKKYSPESQDCTIEILMYDLQGSVFNLFSKQTSSKEVQNQLKFNDCFPSFTIQDHAFQPKGYSLNALKGEEYYTIHVTPQEVGFYVSFETNMKESFSSILNKIILLFRPSRFDVITFTPSHIKTDSIQSVDPFLKNYSYKQLINCGFDVEFSSFQIVKEESQPPYSF